MMGLFSMLGGAALAVNAEHLAAAGKIMLLGMGGIFVVILIIYLIVLALTKFFPEKKG
ncbi:MAG: OadG-related small transporter subunit [Acetanaerobacterium sp.]